MSFRTVLAVAAATVLSAPVAADPCLVATGGSYFRNIQSPVMRNVSPVSTGVFTAQALFGVRADTCAYFGGPFVSYGESTGLDAKKKLCFYAPLVGCLFATADSYDSVWDRPVDAVVRLPRGSTTN